MDSKRIDETVPILPTVTSSRYLPLPADQNPWRASAVHLGLNFTVISALIAAAVPY